MIEGHGNDRYNYGDKIKIDFSSNIAFNNHSERIVEYLGSRLSDIKNYPDPTTRLLTEKLSQRYGIDQDSLMVCNGSAESFYLTAHYIARVNKSQVRTLIFTPSFAEYEDSCRVYGHTLDFTHISNFNEVDYSPYDSVWIGTPNNPDGYRVSVGLIEQLAMSNPNTIFVVDRAYNDLSNSCDIEDRAMSMENIIYISSLTKTFGIPGLRLGYLAASVNVVEQLKEMRPPWSVNALSLAAGEYVMDNYEALSVDIDMLLGESDYLQKELSKIDYIEVTPSDANFFLSRITDGRSVELLHRYLVDCHGILIRNASNFRGLSECHFRIAAQDRDSNNQLINALREWR